MTPDKTAAAEKYIEQQLALGMPDIILSEKTAGSTIENRLSEPEAPCETRKDVVKPGSHEEKRDALKQIYSEVKNCSRCPLSSSRNRTVFGAGNASSRVLIIGEAPGADEDRTGMPFVGRAGQLLTKMLAAIDLDRKKDVFITNILKCRPPGNRNPNQNEAAACRPFLERQIEIINPSVILLLGRIAASHILNTDSSISRLRGKIIESNGRSIIVTYHPSALLRNQVYKPKAYEDLKLLKKHLSEN